MRSFSMFLVAAFLLLSSGHPFALDDSEGAIRVTVNGFRGAEGQLGCLMFKDENGFPMDTGEAARMKTGTIQGSSANCTFDGVPQGTYAIAVVHDANRNSEVDTNWLGIPKEGVAVSNNVPPGTFGPPKFDDAKFVFDGQRLETTLDLIY